MSIPSLNTSNFEKPENLLSTIQTLQEQIQPILDDFVKYYVSYNSNPTNSEYQQMYNNIKSNLNNINSQLFIISNTVDSNTSSISKNMLKLDKSIDKMKKESNVLKKKIGVIGEKMNSADELIDNYKQMYEMGYLRNWGLFLSIIGSCVLLSIVFKKKQVLQQNGY